MAAPGWRARREASAGCRRSVVALAARCPRFLRRTASPKRRLRASASPRFKNILSRLSRSRCGAVIFWLTRSPRKSPCERRSSRHISDAKLPGSRRRQTWQGSVRRVQCCRREAERFRGGRGAIPSARTQPSPQCPGSRQIAKLKLAWATASVRSPRTIKRGRGFVRRDARASPSVGDAAPRHLSNQFRCAGLGDGPAVDDAAIPHDRDPLRDAEEFIKPMRDVKQGVAACAQAIDHIKEQRDFGAVQGGGSARP